MNLIRKYKLYKLGYNIDPENIRVINFIEQRLFNLKLVKNLNNVKFPRSIFFFDDDGCCLMEYFEPYETLYLHQSKAFDFFEFHKNSQTGISRKVILDILKYHYNIHANTLSHRHGNRAKNVEKYYDLIEKNIN